MSFASAHVSNVKTLVSIQPASAFILEHQQHDHSSCISVIETGAGGHKRITARDEGGRMKSWQVQKCAQSNDTMMLEEENNAISQLVSIGHDTACLFMDIGGNHATFTKKIEQKREIISKLDQISGQNTIMEFAYFGFTDTYCYDLRRDVICSCDNVLQKGIDYWLKQVSSTTDIWQLVSRGSKIPSILKIKLTNTATKRQGSLCIVDLGHPRFSPATDSQNSIYRSFENLLRLIDAVVKTSDNKTSSEAVITDYYLLTDVLAKFICGQGYMVVCAHLQECIVQYRTETDLVLDLLELLGSIKVRSLAHDPVIVERSSNFQLNHYKSKYEETQKTLSELFSTLRHLKSDYERLRIHLDEKTHEYESKLIHTNHQKEGEIHDLKHQTLLERKAILKDHRRAIKSLKQLAFFRISVLKNENKEYQVANQELKHKVAKYKSILAKLRVKSSQLVKRSKEKEAQLLGEINIMKGQTIEIRNLFANFKKNLVDKGVDLDL